ncbi:hypothetical protein F2Q70_00010016 [Brassica cretica]|uniref:Uncharacterized protein n=1 Tax=Brassica cretica TaxID=69181 RepID=A0A8S9LXL4_BRACR|nr:hypothetical protein F2Q70_00010016 [Brassica cretica]
MKKQDRTIWVKKPQSSDYPTSKERMELLPLPPSHDYVSHVSVYQLGDDRRSNGYVVVIHIIPLFPKME